MNSIFRPHDVYVFARRCMVVLLTHGYAIKTPNKRRFVKGGIQSTVVLQAAALFFFDR